MAGLKLRKVAVQTRNLADRGRRRKVYQSCATPSALNQKMVQTCPMITHQHG